MWARLSMVLVLVVLVSACTASDTTTSSTVTEPLTTTTVMSTLAPLTTTSSTSTTTATTAPSTTTGTASTTPAPPMLEVNDPTNGAVVYTQVYTFRGVTDPGCSVSVGDRYYADVDADGTWSLDLKLRVGGNTTTITASDPTGMTTRTQVAVDYLPDLTLRPDGLGPFDFGDPVDEVADGLIAILGPPTDDETVLTEEWEVYGFATDGYWRGMSWQELQLFVVFSDSRDYLEDGTQIHGHTSDGGFIPYGDRPSTAPHFNGWMHRAGGTVLTTNQGIGPGSTVDDLRAAFGDNLVLPDEPDACTDYWNWHVRDPRYPFEHWRTFRGGLNGDPANPSTIVTGISAGTQASC